MSRSLTPVVLVAFALAAMALGATPAAVDSCSNLISNASLRSLPGTTITSATVVSGAFTPPGGGQGIQGLPSFCRVAATLKPSPVSDVKIEVWLPTEGWNQKLQAVGNGGLAGTISYAALAIAIKGGFASVSTGTGHIASDTTWLHDEEKEKDYGYRAIHGMTVLAKVVAQQFYGAVTLLDAFEGRRMLIAYYFMWHTGHPAPEQCEGCTWVTWLHRRCASFLIFILATSPSPCFAKARTKRAPGTATLWAGRCLGTRPRTRSTPFWLDAGWAGCTSFATCDKEPRSSRLTGQQVAASRRWTTTIGCST
jgi:hypothetical protein